MKRLKGHWDRRLGRLFVLLLIPCVFAYRVSVVMRPVRALYVLTLLVGVSALIAYVLRLLLPRRRLLLGAMVVPVALIVWAVTAGRSPDTDLLRREYINRLGAFRNTRYVWGGENRSGIDCSGLARTALWQAMLRRGIVERNPRLLGPTLWKFWWRDMSARAMLKGNYGYTKRLTEIPKLAGYDTSGVKPGDLAVTSSGVHVMIYCGDGKWIEASPEDLKVVANKAPADSKRGWFQAGPVTLMRWWILAPQPSLSSP